MKRQSKSEKLATEGLDILVNKAVKNGVFPGAAFGISTGFGEGEKKAIRWFGYSAIEPKKRKLQENDFFDLASLTKPLATTLAILCLLKKKKVGLDEKLPTLLERDIKGVKKNITLRQLLSHQSGLAAHQRFFDNIVIGDGRGREMVQEWLLAEKPVSKPGSCTIYSDLGFMILGWIVERKTSMPLNDFVINEIYKPLDLADKIFFSPLCLGKKKINKNFVATENCPWRHKVLCGEVHDDNCFAMGGVAGHSGLFGNINGVLQLLTFLLDQWKNRVHHPAYNNSDLAEFLTRQDSSGKSTWALGFDTPSPVGSSCGSLFAPTSIGHLGFTGTSFWVDPTKELVVVLLTNRVHPTRDNWQIKEFRPLFHNTVVKVVAETL